MKEGNSVMGLKIVVGILLLFTLVGISIPVYGIEKSVKNQGNIKGMGEQIICLKEDYFYLQSEIQSLLEECK